MYFFEDYNAEISVKKRKLYILDKINIVYTLKSLVSTMPLDVNCNLTLYELII